MGLCPRIGVLSQTMSYLNNSYKDTVYVRGIKFVTIVIPLTICGPFLQQKWYKEQTFLRMIYGVFALIAQAGRWVLYYLVGDASKITNVIQIFAGTMAVAKVLNIRKLVVTVATAILDIVAEY
jgi:hypothetical protein